MSDVPHLQPDDLQRATKIVASLLRHGKLSWGLPSRSVAFVFVPLRPRAGSGLAMSQGLVCLNCGRYIDDAKATEAEGEYALPCRCAHPRPSWDGKTPAVPDDPVGTDPED